MKAAQLIKYDEKEAIAINDIEVPAAEAGKLLVEVHEAGVNPADWKIRAGMMPAPLPTTMGEDFAGVVIDVGSGVSGFEPGDEIYGMAGPLNGKGTGSFAEYEEVDADAVAPRPKSVSEMEAGALPLTGIMALQAMTEHLELSPGKKILIQGGGGGIGSIAIQIAKHLGAYVATTCAADEFDYVRSLGADEAIDFRTQKFEEIVHGYDAVYDLVGGDIYKRSFQVLTPGGTIVSSLMQPDAELMEKHQVNAILQMNQVTTERLTRLAELVDQGAIKVHVEKTFPLEETGEAMTYLKTVHPKGKVVIDVK